MTGTSHTARPLPISGTLAVLAGIVAVRLIADGPAQTLALGLTVVGLVAIAAGIEARHRYYRVLGAVVALGGLAVALVAIGWGIAATVDITPKLVLVPGLVGLVVVTLGLSAVVPGYERWFVSAGAGLLLVAVLFAGFARSASPVALLTATVATVATWDVGEQSINMGEQLGRAAETWRVEVAHWGVGVLVGGVGLLVAVAISGAGISGLPLVGLVAMLGAALFFAIALYT